MRQTVAELAKQRLKVDHELRRLGRVRRYVSKKEMKKFEKIAALQKQLKERKKK